ncbi:MAG: glycosyltransferase [Acidimicrobiales bacterium]
MITRVDQFLPVFIERDAVGSHVVEVAGVLAEMGLETTAYAGLVSPEVLVAAERFDRWRPRAGSVCLYHLATGSPIADHLVSCGLPLVIDYHNITPPEWFRPWDPELAVQASWGRSQLARLAPRAVFGIADSTVNAEELHAAGCRDVVVSPVILDPARTSDPDIPAPDSRSSDWLFVGRLAPNKGQVHLVRALAALGRLGDHETRLHLVGGPSPAAYADAVRAVARELGVEDRVVVHGSLDDGRLTELYRSAGVFVCASGHEGFGVPLVEAMAHGLPVVAVRSTAVPETVGNAALLVDEADPLQLALAARRATLDAPLRDALVVRGTRRAAELGRSVTRAQFRDALTTMLEVVGS